MTDGTIPPALWQETRQAADAWEQARKPRTDPAASDPGPIGQVLTLPELAEPRLAWAALHRETGSGTLLLVAADVNPLVGSGDIAVAAPAVGALTLRCRFAVRANERDLGPTTLLGILPPEALARAEARRQDIAANRPVGTFTEQETEEDPEYQDWIDDVVRPVVGKLEARFGAAAPSPPPALPVPTPPPEEPLVHSAWLRWAAVLAFVALGAGSGFFWWRQGQEIAGLRAAVVANETAHQQAIAELEARRSALERQYREQLHRAGQDRERVEAEYLAKVQDLKAKIAGLRRSSEVKNAQLISLDAGSSVRGTEKTQVGPEVSHLLLLLSVDDPAGTEFQVEVYDRHSNQQVFVQKGLRSDDRGEVWLGVPATLMPPGDYRVRLLRKAEGAWKLVREHLIEVKPEPVRRRSPW